MCLHCGLNLSEVLPSWLKDLAWNFDHLLPLANSVLRTPGGLARSKETSAFNIRNLGEGIGGPRNDTILAGILFQDGKIYGVPLNSWLLCLLCFPCDGSRRFIVTAAPNSQRITDNSDQTFELLTLWHFNYPIWSLDSVWRCFAPVFSLHVGKVRLERFHNGQPNVSEIDWNMCSTGPGTMEIFDQPRQMAGFAEGSRQDRL